MQAIGKRKQYFMISAKYELPTSDKHLHTMFLYSENQYPDLVDILRYVKKSFNGAENIWVIGINPMPQAAFMRWHKALQPEKKTKIITK